ncbi:MAG: MFS transporter [Pyrinomonadaceae bacterium]|nr:MFS transporter [Phycisphaerales bacterium]
MHKLNPFRGLPNPREVWAWGMYDLANQSFQLLINTLLFSLYIQKVVYTNNEGLPDEAGGKRAWGMLVAVSMLLVAVASPLAGAWADQRAWKRELLLATGVLCVILTFCMSFVGPGMFIFAVALYLPAAFCCGLGENFLASFLPEISTAKTMGRVSAIGWTMSYIGALLLLIVCAVVVFGFHITQPDQWRWLFTFAALWFLIGMIPTTLFLKEKALPLPAAQRGSLISETFGRLAQTIRQAKHHRQFFRFLGVFFIYSLGTQTVIYFAGIIGDGLGFQIGQLILMSLIMAATAGVGAFVSGKFQDRLGHRRIVMLFLVSWVIGTLSLACLKKFEGDLRFFWLVSGIIGFALGGIGTSSRAMVGVFTPPEKSAEFFGLWGMVYKAAILGPVVFSLVTTLVSESTALFMLSGTFAVGLILMLRIDEKTPASTPLHPSKPSQ